MRYEIESLQELAKLYLRRAEQEMESAARAKSVRQKMYYKASAASYTDCAQIARDAVLTKKKEGEK